MNYSGLDPNSSPCGVRVPEPMGFAGSWWPLYSHGFSFSFQGTSPILLLPGPLSGSGMSPAIGQAALLLIFGLWVPDSPMV